MGSDRLRYIREKLWQMKPNHLFLLLLSGIFSYSCSPRLTPLDQRLIDKNNWGPAELQRIQFYLSQDIVLRRQAESAQTSIKNGKIKYVNGEKIEEVIFERGTPGVVLFSPKENRLAVSFEQEGKDAFLMFGPNPKFDNRYVLLGKEWDRHSGIVTYNGKEYTTTSGSAFSGLLINLKQSRVVEKNTRVPAGRKLD